LRQQGFFEKSSQTFIEERARLYGSLTAGNWRIELANEASVFVRTANVATSPLPVAEPTSAWNTRGKWAESDSVLGTHRVDRANVRFREGDWEMIVGKQVVPNGVGHLFSAVSQVPRQPFVVLDPEFPITEDGVTASWNGPFTIEARYLPRVAGQTKDNFHLRAKGSQRGTDVAVTAGKSDDKTYLGLEAAGNWGDSILRGEMVGYDKNSAGWVQALLGWDYAYSATWRNEWEIFYNGFGTFRPRGFSAPLHRSAPYQGQWYLGSNVVYDPDPRWKISLLTTIALPEPSALFHLSVTHSLDSNLDIISGAYLGVGSRDESEFGGKAPALAGMALGLPDMIYLLLKWSF